MVIDDQAEIMHHFYVAEVLVDVLEANTSRGSLLLFLFSSVQTLKWTCLYVVFILLTSPSAVALRSFVVNCFTPQKQFTTNGIGVGTDFPERFP